MNIQEFEAYETERLRCPKCNSPLDALDKQERLPKNWCSDCYYEALGEEIEKYPIGPSIVRHPPKTKHKYEK